MLPNADAAHPAVMPTQLHNNRLARQPSVTGPPENGFYTLLALLYMKRSVLTTSRCS